MAYNAVKVGEKQLAELGNQLREMVGADPPASVSECTTFVKSRKDEWALSDADVVKVCINFGPVHTRRGLMIRCLVMKAPTEVSGHPRRVAMLGDPRRRRGRTLG